MRVTSVEAFLLHDKFVFVKVSTDDGVDGWGEAAFHAGPITAEIVRRLGDKVIGSDPFESGKTWTALFRSGYRIGTTGAHLAAIAGIDIALHDIKGRALGVPIHALLGGKIRDSIPFYASLMKRDLPVEQDVERVEALVSQGYGWVKLHTATHWGFDGGNDNTVATVKALRDAIGGRDRLKILIDANHAYTLSSAIRVGRALEGLDVTHFEEPIAPWDYAGYDQLQAALDIAIAVGEQEYNLWQFRDLIQVAHADILQPNITSCGGYTQGQKIAALAETYNRPLVFHNTEPTLMTVAQLHLMATSTMVLHPQEYYGEDNHPLRDKTPVVHGMPPMVQGCMRVPDGPGLGVEVDDQSVRSLAAG